MKKQELLAALEREETKNIMLERQVAFLLRELLGLSQGLGVKPLWYNEMQHSWRECMSHKAGLAIKKLHEMRK